MNIRKLRVESLEERALLAVVAGGIEQAVAIPAPTESTTWIVNTVEDPTEWDLFDDTYSLREAISRAQTGDMIVFDKSLTDGEITLNGTEINITRGITIDATSIGGVTIDANHNSRIFRVIIASSWLSVEGEDDYVPAADINGDGDVSGVDRQFLSSNWCKETGEDDLVYPRQLAADLALLEFASADLRVDFDMF